MKSLCSLQKIPKAAFGMQMKRTADIKRTAPIFHIVKNNIVVSIRIQYHPVNSRLLSLSRFVTRYRNIENYIQQV